MIANIVVFSDFQVGSASALWPKVVITDQENTIHPNPTQEWLYRCYRDALRRVKKLRPKPTGVFLGEGIQGDKPGQAGLCASNVKTQAHALETLLKPLVTRCEEFYWIKSTKWHVGPSAQEEKDVAERLEAKPRNATDHTWPSLYLDIGGPVINFAHAIGTSRVAHYQSSVVLRDTLQIIDETKRYTEESPNIKVVVRGHRHRCVVVGVPPDIWGATTPCWQWVSEYAEERGFSLYPHIGWLLIQWDGEDIVIKPRTYIGPKRHVEVAPCKSK